MERNTKAMARRKIRSSLTFLHESYSNLIRTDRPESPTNFAFFLLIFCLIVWESYAIYTKTSVPDIEAFCALVFSIKFGKAYNDRKNSEINYLHNPRPKREISPSEAQYNLDANTDN